MIDRRIHEGMKVRSSDGENLGKVVSCGTDTFMIEKGFFFPKDHSARYEQVRDIREDEVWLRDSKDRLMGGGSSSYGYGDRPQGGERLGSGTTQETRIPLAEEQLRAEKERRLAGEVEIRKEVHTEHQSVNVPVTREAVQVERRPASGAPAAGAFREETVRIPVYEEEVELHKRPIVREGVVATKHSTEEEERLSGEVRKETADIKGEGDLREKRGR